MALVVTGHQRSGTSLLLQLCDLHPEMMLTSEVGFFFDLGLSLRAHRSRMLRRWWQARNRPFYTPHRQWVSWHYEPVDTTRRPPRYARWLKIQALQNLSLVALYLLRLQRMGVRQVEAGHISAALSASSSAFRLVGDKHPDYSFMLDRLASAPGLTCVVIYRDPRDVVCSMLEAVRSDWKRWWSAEAGTAEQIAHRWVRCVDLMERHSEQIIAIRYESLVTEPKPVLAELGRRLEVDPRGFRVDLARRDRVGRHTEGLTTSETDTVMRVAGDAMQHLGYRV
jgi:hypothetical protein